MDLGEKFAFVFLISLCAFMAAFPWLQFEYKEQVLVGLGATGLVFLLWCLVGEHIKRYKIVEVK